MDEKTVLHILRNPHGKTDVEIKCARLTAADLIEKYREAYLNMRDWTAENSVDTSAHYPGSIERLIGGEK